MTNGHIAHEKLVAHRAVHAAVKRGDLIKPDTCIDCGETFSSEMIDAHHYLGYATEHHLDVQWLCKRCHGLKHGGALLITDDQRRAGVAVRMSRYTPEERSASSLSRGTPEQRSAWVRKAAETANSRRTPEERSALARKAALAGVAKRRAQKTS